MEITTERKNRAKEAFQNSKITSDIEMLKNAHSRLFNQFKQLENDFNSLIVDANLNNINLSNRIKELENYIDNLTLPVPEKNKFVDGNMYTETIEEIISIQDTRFDNKDFSNMLIKFQDRPEVYKIFVLKGKEPKIKDKIIFVFDASSDNLKKVRIR